MSIDEAKAETRLAWELSYSPERNAQVVESLADRSFQYRAGHLIARLFFRGIYFPQMGKRAWMKLLFENRRALYGLTREAAGKWKASRQKSKLETAPPV